MRSRLIVAFIVIALLAALASQQVINLLLPGFPALHVLADTPGWALLLVYNRPHPGGGMPQQRRDLRQDFGEQRRFRPRPAVRAAGVQSAEGGNQAVAEPGVAGAARPAEPGVRRVHGRKFC